jgi:phosphate-selective porin
LLVVCVALVALTVLTPGPAAQDPPSQEGAATDETRPTAADDPPPPEAGAEAEEAATDETQPTAADAPPAPGAGAEAEEVATDETQPTAAGDPPAPGAGAEAEEAATDETQPTAADNPPAADGGAKARPRTIGQKWGLFLDATRGLVTWNLFKGRLTLKAYARIQVDGTTARYNEPLAERVGEDRTNSIDIRRLPVYITGTIDNHLRYVAGYVFGPDRAIWDTYVEGIDSGLRIFGYRIGRFRAGFFQEPFSLERKTSSSYTGFLERSLPVWTFTPGNNVGYMVHDTAKDDRLNWAAGFFSFGQRTENNASSSTLSVTARLGGRLIDRDDGRRLLHLGGSYSSRTPQSSETRYRSHPEARFVDTLVDTGSINSSRIKLGGLEAAAHRGPLWLQAEVVGSEVTSAEFGQLQFWGSYVQAGWFLTGETRPFDRSEARVGRVIPKNKVRRGNPFKRSNSGALEFVGRASNVNLHAEGISGGKMVDLSLGVNWYIDATSKLMFNYIRSRVNDEGKANIFLLRFQYRPKKR